ncbi:MAG: hypothetical protein ACP5RW_09780 [bacterium]
MNNILLPIILRIAQEISPELKKEFLTLLNDLAIKAKQTESPIDDLFVEVIRIFLVSEAR